MTTFADMVYGLGGVPLLDNIPFSKGSRAFFVDPDNGSSGNDGRTPDHALALVSQALAKCAADNNDVIFLLGTATGNTETAVVDWNKGYTHLIGVCAPTAQAQRARIFAGSAINASPFFLVEADGCIFKNIYSFEGVAHAASLVNWNVTGSRNYFENVHFAGGGATQQAIDNGASLKLSGTAGENLFKHCTIGVDTVAAAAGMDGLIVAGPALPRNTFENCLFTLLASAASAAWVELTGVNDIDRFLLFDRCTFLNFGTAMTSGIVIPAGQDATNKRIVLRDCWQIGATDWDANNRGLIYANMGTITAGGNAGIMQASNST